MLIKRYCCRYNGHLPSGDKGRKKSKFILGKKPSGNGVKPFRKHVVKNALAAKVYSLSLSPFLSFWRKRNLTFNHCCFNFLLSFFPSVLDWWVVRYVFYLKGIHRFVHAFFCYKLMDTVCTCRPVALHNVQINVLFRVE